MFKKTFYLFLILGLSAFIAACDDDESNPEASNPSGVAYGPLQGTWMSDCHQNPQDEDTYLQTTRNVQGGNVRVTLEVFSGVGCTFPMFTGWIDFAYEVGDPVTVSSYDAYQIDLTVIGESRPGLADNDHERDIFAIDNSGSTPILILGEVDGDPTTYPTDLDLNPSRLHFRL